MDRADVGDHRRPRARRSPPARRSGPAPRIAISRTRTSVSARRLEHGQRQPDLGVEVLAVGVDAARQQRPGDVLDRGLADRAGDPDHAGAERPPPGAGQRLQRRQRVLDGEDPGPVAVVLCAAIRDKRDVSGGDDHAPGAGLDRGGGELAAVDVARRAGRRRGRRARLRRSRSSPARATRRRPRRRPRPRSRRRSRSAPRFTAGLPSFRSSSRATSRSSKGTLRPSSNSWPCSWPLPAITTVSPGSARPERERDRGAPVDLDLDLGAALDPGEDFGDDRLRVLGARVVGGDDRQVRAARRRPGPSSAACRGRGRRRRRRPRSPGRSVSRRAARSTFSSESGVWA